MGRIIKPDWYVKNNTGMMGVVPAWKLAQMFEMPEVKAILAADHAEARARFRSKNSEATRD